MAAATQLQDFWYVVARTGDVGAKPLARKLNGRALVVFRDHRGNASVLDAICPHRGANLAHGRIVDGCIACPYHGWRFDGAGRCALIPSHRGPIPAGHATENFPVIEQQGLVWTCIGKPVAPPPRFAVLDDRTLHAFCYELVAPVPFDWWVENALDFAHLPFVHPSTIGDQQSSLDEFTIERRSDDLGFVARTATRADHSLFGRLLKLDMTVAVTLDMPGSTLFDIDLGKGRRQGILAIATPEDGSTTRVWNFAVRNFLLRVPFVDTIGRLFVGALLREDLGIAAKSLELVSIDRRMSSTRADELSLEFLRLLRVWRARGRSSAGLQTELDAVHDKRT